MSGGKVFDVNLQLLTEWLSLDSNRSFSLRFGSAGLVVRLQDNGWSLNRSVPILQVTQSTLPMIEMAILRMLNEQAEHADIDKPDDTEGGP